jgi:hypothetical protein
MADRLDKVADDLEMARKTAFAAVSSGNRVYQMSTGPAPATA